MPFFFKSSVAGVLGLILFISFAFLQSTDPEPSFEVIGEEFPPVVLPPEEVARVFPHLEPEHQPPIEEAPQAEPTPAPLPEEPSGETLSAPQGELPAAPLVTASASDIHTLVREALVNILCIASPESPVSSISGSGVVIDDRGTILTNAHIAQVLLVADIPRRHSVSCAIRTGSPARDAYFGELVYLSPRWVLENTSAIATPNPTGTGKDDFALLRVSESSHPSRPLPEHFPHLPLSYEEPKKGEVVIAAGYPASFLSGAGIQSGLVALSTVSPIREVYTFFETTLDVLSLGGVPLAQQGASGGAVVNASGSLVGLVVTSSLEGDTRERDLRAITLAHVERSFFDQHGISFSALLSEGVEHTLPHFPSVREGLRDLLLSELSR